MKSSLNLKSDLTKILKVSERNKNLFQPNLTTKPGTSHSCLLREMVFWTLVYLETGQESHSHLYHSSFSHTSCSQSFMVTSTSCTITTTNGKEFTISMVQTEWYTLTRPSQELLDQFITQQLAQCLNLRTLFKK